MPKIRWLAVYAVTTFIMAVTVVTFFKEIGRIERLADALEVKMEELVELTRRNQELQEKITYYSSPAGVAHVATEEYNLVRPGEKIYRIEIISEEQLPKQ
ncbi:MAG: septum formation initiator family protein [Synergistaceae bacterium]|jgi:cell division protein FtsB|nr:septum formation initiator family protein [Synergistaceae bacterium]